IVDAECSLVVVAGYAALRLPRRMMHFGDRSGHLILWRRFVSDAMAVVAIELLPRAMRGVAEIDLEGFRGNRDAGISPHLMAGVTRRGATSLHLLARGMTLVTGRMRGRS